MKILLTLFVLFFSPLIFAEEVRLECKCKEFIFYKFKENKKELDDEGDCVGNKQISLDVNNQKLTIHHNEKKNEEYYLTEITDDYLYSEYTILSGVKYKGKSTEHRGKSKLNRFNLVLEQQRFIGDFIYSSNSFKLEYEMHTTHQCYKLEK